MIRFFLLVTCLLCTLPSSAQESEKAAHRPHRREAKEEIAQCEQRWRMAVLNSDIGLMDSLLSDDYVGISITGQVNTKAMQLDRLRNRTLVLSRLDLSDVKVKLIGKVAIVTSLAQIDGTNEGTPMAGTFRYTRVYQRAGNGIWKITNFEATRIGGRLHADGGDRS